VEDIETAMFTTRRPDGLLVFTPDGRAAPRAGRGLWFVAATGSHKPDEIRIDRNVNKS
jgi:hypothetical protein